MSSSFWVAGQFPFRRSSSSSSGDQDASSKQSLVSLGDGDGLLTHLRSSRASSLQSGHLLLYHVWDVHPQLCLMRRAVHCSCSRRNTRRLTWVRSLLGFVKPAAILTPLNFKIIQFKGSRARGMFLDPLSLRHVCSRWLGRQRRISEPLKGGCRNSRAKNKMFKIHF